MAAKKVVCLGDSITWGFPFGPHYSWVEMLSRATGIEFINRGINGDTTNGMLRRLSRDVLELKPSHLVLSGCINDIICGESFDRITWNVREMVEKAEAAGITVILGQPTAVESAYMEKLLVRLRRWYREFAAKKNLALIEFDRAFLDREGRLRQELLLADGAHPSEAGYRALFEQIDQSLFTE